MRPPAMPSGPLRPAPKRHVCLHPVVMAEQASVQGKRGLWCFARGWNKTSIAAKDLVYNKNLNSNRSTA